MAAAMGATLHLGWLAAAGDAPRPKGRVETAKLPPVSVPMLVDGQVRGYVIARFSVVTVDADPSLKVEAFVVDEIFRSIYSSAIRDLDGGDKTRMSGLTNGIVERVNSRLGRPFVRELLVQEWSWIGKQDARH